MYHRTTIYGDEDRDRNTDFVNFFGELLDTGAYVVEFTRPNYSKQLVIQRANILNPWRQGATRCCYHQTTCCCCYVYLS